MEIKFGKQYLADVYEGKVHKYKDYKSNPSLVRQYVKTVKRLYVTGSTEELKKQRALNFEKLRGDLKGICSVRINQQYRLLFKVVEEGSSTKYEVLELQDISKHYE
ncbi:type II toxin-antitoxin system RelE/ParE family toxin [uncultured Roseivirga sp.]|jgi:proteic killer suppression protein|uniref:type II toxin-antitoxin system RelE/ParE family toxin n=1 Tax=uncultured Roseivirga sp. TaxID=543088 RepID=UPI000D7919ED|nr:type II toxin-antitoxin system RelE/ParE family toxin [uncultured Roseivirga sp.]PWL30740.1 MAG: addiction module killer protein [Roseivirga sp. XM-24bin3]